MKTILIIVALLPIILSAGCSNTKLGAFCYLPHGQQGSCTVAPPAPASAAK